MIAVARVITLVFIWPTFLSYNSMHKKKYYLTAPMLFLSIEMCVSHKRYVYIYFNYPTNKGASLNNDLTIRQ